MLGFKMCYNCKYTHIHFIRKQFSTFFTYSNANLDHLPVVSTPTPVLRPARLASHETTPQCICP